MKVKIYRDSLKIKKRWRLSLNWPGNWFFACCNHILSFKIKNLLLVFWDTNIFYNLKLFPISLKYFKKQNIFKTKIIFANKNIFVFFI